MKLKNVKVGEQYIIKSLEHSYVGAAPFKVGDVYTVNDFCGSMGNTVTFLDAHGKKWDIHHKDLKQLPIQYTHPMQEHLGKEVITTQGRGWIVGYTRDQEDTNLLVDYGDGYDGHDGAIWATHPYITKTCDWVHCNDCKFLTESDE